MEGGGCGVGLRLGWGFSDAYGTSTTRTSWNTYFKMHSWHQIESNETFKCLAQV
jgi:hypothetical protein